MAEEKRGGRGEGGQGTENERRRIRPDLGPVEKGSALLPLESNAGEPLTSSSLASLLVLVQESCTCGAASVIVYSLSPLPPSRFLRSIIIIAIEMPPESFRLLSQWILDMANRCSSDVAILQDIKVREVSASCSPLFYYPSFLFLPFF